MQRPFVPLFALLTASTLPCGCFRPESRTQEFVAADVRPDETAAAYGAIVETVAREAGIPAEKISAKAMLLSGQTPDGTTEARNSSLAFRGLTEAEFERLRAYFNQGYRMANETVFQPDIELEDLLPPLMQALAKHRFQVQRVRRGAFEADVTANCWSTAYEMARFRMSGRLDYTVFYADGTTLEPLFGNPEHMAAVGTFSISESAEILKNTRAGDLLQFYSSDFIHSAVVVAPGLLFEKTDPSAYSFFRLTTLAEAIAAWDNAGEIRVQRPQGRELPHPHSLADGVIGGNTISHTDGFGFALAVQLPRLVRDDTGKFHLPAPASMADTYQFMEFPGRPLNTEGPWNEYVSLNCRTREEVDVRANPWPTARLLGRVAAGTELLVIARSFEYLEAAMVTTIDGRLLSGRALVHPWFEEDALECTAAD